MPKTHKQSRSHPQAQLLAAPYPPSSQSPTQPKLQSRSQPQPQQDLSSGANSSTSAIDQPNMMQQPTHDSRPTSSSAHAPGSASKPTSTPWVPADDEILLRARASGLNWAPIQQQYFPNKTPNACRKRHERLMEKRSAEDYDGVRLETLARA